MIHLRFNYFLRLYILINNNLKYLIILSHEQT